MLIALTAPDANNAGRGRFRKRDAVIVFEGATLLLPPSCRSLFLLQDLSPFPVRNSSK